MAGTIKVDQVQSDSNLSFNLAGSNVAYLNATSLQLVSSNISLAGTNVFTNGKVLATAMPSGAILQAVHFSTSTGVTNNTGTYVSSGLAATITPISTSSRIFIFGNLNINLSSNGGNIGQSYKIDRNGTSVCVISNKMNVNAIVDQALQSPISFIDSPASTSALTYTIYFAQVNSTGPYGGTTVNPTITGTTTSSLILMEIA